MTISDDPSIQDTAAGKGSGAATNGGGDASDPLGWQSILAAVAAAAGSAAWVSAVGSGVIGARLDNAGMPVESVLALMPAEQRFAVGVGHLLAPLFVGLVGFLADLALTVRTGRLVDSEPTPRAEISLSDELRDVCR